MSESESETDHKDNLKFKLCKGTDDQTNISRWTVDEGLVHGSCPQCNGKIYATFIGWDSSIACHVELPFRFPKPYFPFARRLNSATQDALIVTLKRNCRLDHPGCTSATKGCGWYGQIKIEE
jgi:hypothetical protein